MDLDDDDAPDWSVQSLDGSVKSDAGDAAMREWPPYRATCEPSSLTGKLSTGGSQRWGFRYHEDAPCGPEPIISSSSSVHVCAAATCDAAVGALISGESCREMPGTFEPRWYCPGGGDITLVTLTVTRRNDERYAITYAHHLEAGAPDAGADQ